MDSKKMDGVQVKNVRIRKPLTQTTLALESLLLIFLLLVVVFIIMRVVFRRLGRKSPTNANSVIVETVDVTSVSAWSFIILAVVTVVYYLMFSKNDVDKETRRKRLLAYGLCYVIVSFIFFFAVLYFVRNYGQRAIEWDDRVGQAIDFAAFNTVWCDTVCSRSCVRPTIELPPFTTIPLVWSVDLTAYCIDLIYRVAEADMGNVITPPEGLKVDKTFNGLSLSIPGATFVSIDDPSKTVVWFVARGGGPEAVLGYDPREVVFTRSVTETTVPDTMLSPFASTVLNGMLDGNGNTPTIPSDLTVNTGFWLLYQALRPQWLEYLKTLPPNPARQIVFTGHSSGATYASFAAYDASISLMGSTTQLIVYSIASPRIMNYDLSPIVTAYWRLYNSFDVVSNYPLTVTPNPFDPLNPYFYVDQGIGEGIAFACTQWAVLANHNLNIFYENLSKMKPSV